MKPGFNRPLNVLLGLTLLGGSLDDPNVVEPVEHIFAEQRCAWLHLDDDLPAHDRFPPGEEDRETA